MQGRRLIASAMKKFAQEPSVLGAAWAKMSADFKSIPQQLAGLARERRAMMQEDLVRQCKGRQKPREDLVADLAVVEPVPDGTGHGSILPYRLCVNTDDIRRHGGGEGCTKCRGMLRGYA